MLARGFGDLGLRGWVWGEEWMWIWDGRKGGSLSVEFWYWVFIEWAVCAIGSGWMVGCMMNLRRMIDR